MVRSLRKKVGRLPRKRLVCVRLRTEEPVITVRLREIMKGVVELEAIKLRQEGHSLNH
jgi:hypothetical protein